MTRWPGILLVVLGGLGGPAGAAEFSVQPTILKMPEAGEVTCLLVSGPAGRFRFVPPAGWRMETHPAEQQVRFWAPDLGAFISLQFLSQPDGTGLQGEKAKEFILTEHPQARVLEQFPAYAGCGSGAGFDLLWEQKPGLVVRARLALIPAAQGCIRFALQANTNSWERQLQPFGAVLTSFSAVAPRGGQ